MRLTQIPDASPAEPFKKYQKVSIYQMSKCRVAIGSYIGLLKQILEPSNHDLCGPKIHGPNHNKF